MLTDEQRLLRRINEADWTKTVIDLAQTFRWRTAHFRPGLTQSGNWRTAVQGDGAGFPDLVMTREGALIFAELKRETGKLADSQVEWLADLKKAQHASYNDPFYGPFIRVFVWRPSDFDDVVEILR